MSFLFSPDIIKGKKYKKIVHYLCNVADVIYFTFYEDLSLNDVDTNDDNLIKEFKDIQFGS